MSSCPTPGWLRIFILAAFTFGGALLGGCVTAVKMTGKAVSATVGAAAEVTAATVRGSGKVAAAAVGASGEVADESVQVAAKLSRRGMVVFFDPKSGATWAAPWTEGLKLVAASQTAKVDLALKAVRVIRAGKAINAAKQAAKFVVKSGDVVELVRG